MGIGKICSRQLTDKTESKKREGAKHMKYHVRLSRQMRNLQIAMMICVLLAGIAGASYGILAANTGIWKLWKPAGYVFAVVAMVIALVIAWNGYCEVTTRVIVYPGRKVIVHKGHSVKTYSFDQLRKPKVGKKNPRTRDEETGEEEVDDKYGYSMVLRTKNGRQIVHLSTSYKYVKRLEEDLCRFS
ncbi:MAG: hypothetical protein MJ117_02555 [Lachnospiraceae bacterium]|nr:hypothetical protein [Lachnospiraceae bacterium]